MTWGVSPPAPGVGPAPPAPPVPPAPPALPAPPTLHAPRALLPRQKAGLAGVHPKSCTSTFETFITRVLSKKHNRVNISCPKTISLNCTCMLFSKKRHISLRALYLAHFDELVTSISNTWLLFNLQSQFSCALSKHRDSCLLCSLHSINVAETNELIIYLYQNLMNQHFHLRTIDFGWLIGRRNVNLIRAHFLD